jgi:glycosyltransferase involved in cell wall biosynthesis
MMQQDRLESVRHNLTRVLPFVDVAVIVDNGSTDGTREWLRQQEKVRLIERVWNDSFVEGRNAYLRAIDELAAGYPGETVFCTADDDELYSDPLLQHLRSLARETYLDDINFLRIRVKDTETDWNGDVIRSQIGGWYKPLIYVWEPGIRYVGVNNSEVHEDLFIPSGVRSRRLDDKNGTYFYEHRKKCGEIWPRAIRNAFAGGGGMNLGEQCPWWRDFQRLVREETGAETSDAFLRFLRDAPQLPPRLAEFFVSKRLLGTQWDSTPPQWPGWPDGTSEWREGFLSYYLYFHPECMPLDLIERDRPYKDYRKECLVIHGPASPEWAK